MNGIVERFQHVRLHHLQQTHNGDTDHILGNKKRKLDVVLGLDSTLVEMKKQLSTKSALDKNVYV